MLVVRAGTPSAPRRGSAHRSSGGGGAWLLARELRAEREYGVAVPLELVGVRNMPGWVHTEARRTEVEAALLRDRTRWPAGLATA